MNESEFLTLMSELEALRKGHFLLSSGRHSDTYFQCAKILQFPELATEFGGLLVDKLSHTEIDVVVAPALGAILLGHEVARAIGRRFVFTERVDGTMTLRRGFEIQKNERALIVEDVVTRGTSTREVADIISRNGGFVDSILSLVDRTDESVTLPGALISLARVEVETWDPADCPLCAVGGHPEKPGSRGKA